jgi:hypothetical protein
MLGWLERLGAPLVAPRAGMQRAVEAPAGRGASDVTLLVLLAFVAEQLPGIVHVVFRGSELGVGAAVQSLFILLRALLPLAVAVMVAALVMSVLAGRRAHPREGAPRADALDLSAYALVPFVLVTTLADLTVAIGGRPPSPALAKVVLAVSLAWALVPWLFAMIALRADRSAS